MHILGGRFIVVFERAEVVEQVIIKVSAQGGG